MTDIIGALTEVMGEEFMWIFAMIFIIIFAFYFVGLAVNYVFTGVALYQIGKRRGLRAYGLAWVPFGSTWMMGSVADQLDRKTKGKDRHYRFWLTIGDIVLSALLILWMVAYFYSLEKLMNAVMTGEMADMRIMMDMMRILLLFYAIMIPLIVFSVFYYIALYKVYKSCSPKNSAWLLALAIIVNCCGLQISIPLFCLRRRDDGFLEQSPEEAAAEKARLSLYQ